MRVIFLREGGFGKAGGFIEVEDGAKITGKERVYQRQSFLKLRLKCRNLSLTNTLDIRNEISADDCGERSSKNGESRAAPNRTSQRRISAVGDIQDSHWQRHRLSILGGSTEHSSLDVSIREHPDLERPYLAGMKAHSDLDLEIEERFFVDLVVSSERMDLLVRELQRPGAVLMLDVEAEKFRGFYATWSPAIDEGRVIKFLDDKKDVENVDEIPEAFWGLEPDEAMFHNPDDPLVNISVVRGLSAPTLLQPIRSEERDDEEDDALPAQSPQIIAADPATAEAIQTAGKRIGRRIVVLSVIVILSAFIVAS